MDELEEIRQRKIQEIQAKSKDQIQEQLQLQQQIQQLEIMVKQFFTKEAGERYGNLKAAHPEKSVQLLVILSQLIQQGKVKGKIDDNLLKEVLKQITPGKKEFKIKRK